MQLQSPLQGLAELPDRDRHAQSSAFVSAEKKVAQALLKFLMQDKDLVLILGLVFGLSVCTL